ncbi:hypothetical protein AB0D32_06595 [Micromonospora sp. NPDC048170]|uniref:hypothetical protein n=1 Tax=Micromonospora sp. NPDC048170 TaxID=3154819 RepID=UPI0033D89359
MSTPVSLSTVIMTHPTRLDRARALRQRHPELDMRIVVDPVPDGERCTLRTAAAAWSAVGDGATHHLVVQDDAVLCDDFANRLTAALEAYPTDGLALFCEWGGDTSFMLRLAAVGGIPWVEVTDHYVPSVALVLPAALGREFGESASQNLHEWAKQDDVSLRIFLNHHGVRVVCPVPNLVEHDPGPSLTGNDHMGPRKSACFVDDVGPLPDHGTAALLYPMAVPYFSWFSGETLCVVRDEAHQLGWRPEPAHTALRHRGLDTRAVTRQAQDEVEQWRLDFPGLPTEPLNRLWITAFLTGVVLTDDPLRSVTPAGEPLPDGPALDDLARLDAALSQPAAARALATMSQGTLRTAADPGVLAVLESPLASLVGRSLRLGHEAAVARRDRYRVAR